MIINLENINILRRVLERKDVFNFLDRERFFKMFFEDDSIDLLKYILKVYVNLFGKYGDSDLYRKMILINIFKLEKDDVVGRWEMFDVYIVM